MKFGKKYSICVHRGGVESKDSNERMEELLQRIERKLRRRGG